MLFGKKSLYRANTKRMESYVPPLEVEVCTCFLCTGDLSVLSSDMFIQYSVSYELMSICLMLWDITGTILCIFQLKLLQLWPLGAVGLISVPL